MESSLGELELAYTSFQTAHGSARVVPLQGIAATEHSLGGIIQRAGSADALIDLLARALVDDPRGARVAAEHAVADLDAHRVVVVQGTRQLRRFGYRIHYARNSGQRIEGDLHHLIPLYLGGNHGVGNFLDLDPVIHAELHRLIDGIATEELGTTLAPSAIQSCSELTFETGAAALYPDGRIVLARLGTEGRYEQVSTTFE